MKNRPVIILASLLFLLGIILGGCTPAGPTYIQKIYYRDVSTTTQSGYAFIQFFDNGFFVYCNVETPGAITPLEDAYLNYAEKFLKLIPGATGIPGEAGNYAIVGDQITLNYPSVDDYMMLSGKYSPQQLLITAPDGAIWTYVLYSPGE
jgi:hypothetical protein